MTEDEWLAASDPDTMRYFLHGKVSERKLDLFIDICIKLERIPLAWRTVEADPLIQIQTLRDIFGNPFRPIAFDASWLTSTVVAIAQGMYDSHDFDAMPILADALQDAGCDHPDILTHCRGDGPHVRGCWVIDAILGKA